MIVFLLKISIKTIMLNYHNLFLIKFYWSLSWMQIGSNWDLNKMADVLQTTYWNSLSEMKIVLFVYA